MAAFFVGRIFITPAQIFVNGSREEHVVLQYHGNLVAQRIQVVGADVFAADKDCAL